MNQPSMHRRPRALVIDDEEVLSQLIAEALEQAGLEVLAVTDLREAEVAVTRFRPDIVVTDVFFPEGPCWPFIASLRWLQPPPAIVIMSAFGAAFGPQERELGDAVLAKPFRLSVVVGVVRKLLSERGWPDLADEDDQAAPNEG